MIADLRSYASCDDGDLLVSQSGTTGTPYRGEQATDRGEQAMDRGEQFSYRGERATDRGEHDPSLLVEFHDAIAELGTRPRVPPRAFQRSLFVPKETSHDRRP